MEFYKILLNKWGCDPIIVSIDDLEKAERDLGFRFPQIYLDCAIMVGVFGTTLHLLSQIVDLKLKMHDLSEMTHPKDIFENMKGWQEAGMPSELIPIANDCSGNMFGFDLDDGKITRLQDAPIYFYDHDFDEITLEAESFANWIGLLNVIPMRKLSV